MCTVTYLPIRNNGFILTSNRDESPMRQTVAPRIYQEGTLKLIYPKDKTAGGTWIGASEKNRLVCLLNGGFENHQRNTYYKMSRGVVVKNLLTKDDALRYISEVDFLNIEPFTIVLVDWNTSLNLYELVWDGKKKHFKKLPKEPTIWSSSTLYNKQMKQERQKWFNEWLTNKDQFSQEEIVAFHQLTNKGDPETTLQMKRPYVETVSITSFQRISEKNSMKYIDIKKELVTELTY